MRWTKGFALPMFFTLLALISGTLLVSQWQANREQQLSTIAEIQEVFWLWQQHVIAYYQQQHEWPPTLASVRPNLLNSERLLNAEVTGSVVAQGYQLAMTDLPAYAVDAILILNPLFNAHANGLALVMPTPPSQTESGWIYLEPATGTQQFLVTLNANGHDLTDTGGVEVDSLAATELTAETVRAEQGTADEVRLNQVRLSGLYWQASQLNLVSDLYLSDKLTLTGDAVTAAEVNTENLVSPILNTDMLQSAQTQAPLLLTRQADIQQAESIRTMAIRGGSTTAQVQTAQANRLVAQQASINSVTAVSTAALDYFIPGTSLIANQQTIESLHDQLYHCIYVSLHCLQLINPTVVAKCINCNNGIDAQGFRVFILLNISGCRFYCETSWTLPTNTNSDCSSQTTSIYKEGSYRCELRYYGNVEDGKPYKNVVHVSVFQLLNPLKRTMLEIPIEVSRQIH